MIQYMQRKQAFSKIKTCTFLFLFLASPWPALSSDSQFLSDWRKAFIECVRIESLSPNLMIRNLTLFSLASHDCLNQLEPRFETYLQYDPLHPLFAGYRFSYLGDAGAFGDTHQHGLEFGSEWKW